ncbi:hypothetical protein K2W90_04835 [Candidatus Babeliales bacterium]|nr:hypothetical protein [Candidatus Babeliales bacterium]
MLSSIKQALWGKLTREEFKRFSILSLTLLLILGTYWLMKPLKDALFAKMVGPDFYPYVKILSFWFTIPLILLYSKAVDLFEKQNLFYIFSAFYGSLFFIIALLLAHPTIGLANTTPNKYRILGWALYVTIETFGSLMVALFWAFVASSTNTEAAKRGYALIIAGAQIGTIAGPYIALSAPTLGIPLLMFCICAGVTFIPVLIKIFTHFNPRAAEHHAPSEKTGPIEGLKLLLTRPYLLGVMGVSVLYDIVATILEFQMVSLANTQFHSTEHLARFLSYFGLMTNGSALLISLIGTSFLVRRFGLTFCLVVYPVITAVALLHILWIPVLWVVVGALVVIKSLNYALNNPCKEMLYIPTSRDIKFKAKSWIDMFGCRSAKAGGGFLSTFFTQMHELLFYGPLLSLGVVGVWIIIALYTGTTHRALEKSNRTIE